MRSHDLYTCKTEENLKALLVADGVDPNLSSKVIAKYGLNIEKAEVNIQGDVHFGDKHEHTHNNFYGCCYGNEEELAINPPQTSEEKSDKVFWFLVNGVFYSTMSLVALPVAVVAGVVHISYKYFQRSKEEHEQIAKTATEEEETVEEVVQPKPKKLTPFQEDQQNRLAHDLEMQKMKEEIRQIQLRAVAQRIVWEEKANKGKKTNSIDTEVCEDAKLIT